MPTIPTIAKGALVRVRTTNGGDIIRRLTFNYYHTYDVYLEDNITIPISRIKSVEVAVEEQA
jgi:hypothetical protein